MTPARRRASGEAGRPAPVSPKHNAMRHAIRLLVPLLFLSAAPAAAQQATRALAVGDTVRVRTPAGGAEPLTGVLTAYEHNGLSVRERGTGVERTIPFAEVRGLSRSLGVRRGHSAWAGARIGAFTLGAAGAVAGPLAAAGDTGDRWEIPGTTVAAAAAGVLLGGALGGGLGWVLAREEWQEFRTPVAAQAHAAPGGGTAVGVSLRF